VGDCRKENPLEFGSIPLSSTKTADEFSAKLQARLMGGFFLCGLRIFLLRIAGYFADIPAIYADARDACVEMRRGGGCECCATIDGKRNFCFKLTGDAATICAPHASTLRAPQVA
jgi:hypothetical protein